VVWGSVPQTDEHLPQSTFTVQFFWMTTFCIAFYEPYLSTHLEIILTLFVFTFLKISIQLIVEIL
jgi:hypothetical protein